MKVLKRYFLIWLAFAKASFQADIEFRFNIITQIITDILWYILQISMFSVIYRNVEKIGPWTKPELMVFLGVAFVVDAIYMILVSQNTDRMSELVRTGQLDMLLTKPVNSQFIMSFQRVNTASFGCLFISAAWLVHNIYNLPSSPPWYNYLILISLLPLGFIILYNLRLFFTISAFIFTKAESLNYFFFQFYRLATRPHNIYQYWVRFVLVTVFPLGLVMSAPTFIFLHGGQYGVVLWMVVLSSLLSFAMSKFWKHSLKHYSSASS